MDTKESIAKEIGALYSEGAEILKAFMEDDKKLNFRPSYQGWYTKALRVVEVLAQDRYPEFKSYYEIDPKRKNLGYGTYVIQDHLKGVVPSRLNYPNFDEANQVHQCFFNQLTITNWPY